MARAASALATHLVVLLAEEEDDKGALVGLAGHLGRQVSGMWPFSLSLFHLTLFFYIPADLF